MKLVAGLVTALLTLLVTGASPASATPGPASAPEYWFDSWHVTSLWNDGASGQGVTIAEIDTGVNAALPELAGKILSGKDFGESGNGQVDREVNAFGHGTAMASIMVARPGLLDITGLAPDAKVLPIAVPLNGTTDSGEPGQVVPAIRWAADHGADVINLSLGGKRSAKYDDVPCPADEQAAIFYALRKGAVVVASVGNTGPTQNTVEEPGVCLGVVSVGAVDASGTVASFSGRQPYLTLVAPGVGIPSLSRVPGQAYSGAGTSQAAALVSATVALVRSKYPRLGPRAVVSRLLYTLDAHRTKPSSAYGYGLLDAYRAVTASVPADAPNPVFDAAAPFVARADALAHASRPKPPAPAPAKHASTGTYAIGTAPRLNTPQVITGAALAAAGLLALVLLMVFGVRARRRRGARDLGPNPQLIGVPAEITTGEGARPRTRPSPRPRPRPFSGDGPPG